MGASQSIHIANGFRQEIRGKVAVDRELYTRISREGGGKLSAGATSVEIHGKTEQELEHLIQLPGFVRIASGKYLAFSMAGVDGRVYVSIYTKDEAIADNFPVQNGHSVIIDADGDIKNAQPGAIWRDTEGKRHLISKSQPTKMMRKMKEIPIAMRSTNFKHEEIIAVQRVKDQRSEDEDETSGGIYISSISELVDSIEVESE